MSKDNGVNLKNIVNAIEAATTDLNGMNLVREVDIAERDLIVDMLEGISGLIEKICCRNESPESPDGFICKWD
jgi:hypothetical protein